jgi:predicted anti-sigma-YlaC factor YlaD
MLSCKELTELATDYLEENLRWRERIRVRVHLWMCRNCRTYVDQMRKVIELLRRLPAEPVSPELLQRLLPEFRQRRDSLA